MAGPGVKRGIRRIKIYTSVFVHPLSSTGNKSAIIGPSNQHLAAILHELGIHLKLGHRPTTTPGSGELFIEVKAVALNLVDHYQRDSDNGFLTHLFPSSV